MRRLRLARMEGASQSTAAIILDASIEVRGAVVYASFIEVITLIPIFFLNSLTGSFFKPLASTYALAVMVSLLVALISTPGAQPDPVHAGEGRAPRVAGGQAPAQRLREDPRARSFAGRRPRTACSPSWPSSASRSCPDWGSRCSRPSRSRTSSRTADQAGHVPAGGAAHRHLGQQGAAGDPGRAQDFGSHIGQALLGEETAGVDFGENWISVDPKANYDKTRAEIEETVLQYPGMFTNVETYLAERISEVITGESEPIVVRLLGPDLQTLRDKAQEVKRMLGKIKGVDEVNVELQTVVPQSGGRRRPGEGRGSTGSSRVTSAAPPPR